MPWKYKIDEVVWFMRGDKFNGYKPTQAIIESLHTTKGGIPYYSIIFASDTPNNPISKGMKETELFKTKEDLLNPTLNGETK